MDKDNQHLITKADTNQITQLIGEVTDFYAEQEGAI